MQVGVHVLRVKIGGHLRDHAAHIGRKPQVLCLCSPRGPAVTASTKKLRSAARARAAAKRLANAKEACGVVSTAQLLRQSSVTPATLRAYETGVREFETYARTHKWKLQSGSARDEALVKYGAAMYELGEDAGPMRAAICGMALFRPDLQLPAQSLFPNAHSSPQRFLSVGAEQSP